MLISSAKYAVACTGEEEEEEEESEQTIFDVTCFYYLWRDFNNFDCIFGNSIKSYVQIVVLKCRKYKFVVFMTR